MARTMWGIVRGDRRFARPVSVSVAFDGRPPGPEQDVLILLASTLERLFLGMRPWWGSENAPLHVSLIRAGAPGLLRRLPWLLRGRPVNRTGDPADFQSRNLARLDLLLDGPYTLDGEMYQASRAAGPLRITAAGPVTFARL